MKNKCVQFCFYFLALFFWEQELYAQRRKTDYFLCFLQILCLLELVWLLERLIDYKTVQVIDLFKIYSFH